MVEFKLIKLHIAAVMSTEIHYCLLDIACEGTKETFLIRGIKNSV